MLELQNLIIVSQQSNFFLVDLPCSWVTEFEWCRKPNSDLVSDTPQEYCTSSSADNLVKQKMDYLDICTSVRG